MGRHRSLDSEVMFKLCRQDEIPGAPAGETRAQDKAAHPGCSKSLTSQLCLRQKPLALPLGTEAGQPPALCIQKPTWVHSGLSMKCAAISTLLAIFNTRIFLHIHHQNGICHKTDKGGKKFSALFHKTVVLNLSSSSPTSATFSVTDPVF